MNRLKYLRENSKAIAGSTLYSGFWTTVLYDHWAISEVAGLALANFFIVYQALKKPNSEIRKSTGLVDLLDKDDIIPEL